MLRALNDKVILRNLEVMNPTTSSLIEIAGENGGGLSTGTIMSFGKQCRAPWLQECLDKGHKIVIARYCGDTLSDDDGEYRCVRETDIIGYIPGGVDDSA